MIDFSAISAINQCVYHLARNKSWKWQRLHKTTKKILISIRKKFDQYSKQMCEITKKSETVAPIFSTKKMNVTLDVNSASLNKRD